MFNTLFHGQVPVKISHFCFLFIRNISFYTFLETVMVFLICKKKNKKKIQLLGQIPYRTKPFNIHGLWKKILEKYEITVVHQLTTNNWM